MPVSWLAVDVLEVPDGLTGEVDAPVLLLEVAGVSGPCWPQAASTSAAASAMATVARRVV
jgi:hypothetical protein